MFQPPGEAVEGYLNQVLSAVAAGTAASDPPDLATLTSQGSALPSSAACMKGESDCVFSRHHHHDAIMPCRPLSKPHTLVGHLS
jgi:hypothetical protein